MRRTLCITASVFACLGGSPALAQTAGTLAPPGASGVDEYLETIPTAKGNATPGVSHHALTSKQVAALNRLGPDGRAAAALADATGPTRRARAGAKVTPGTSQGQAPSSLPASGAPRAHGDSPLTVLVRALGGNGGGIGALLPILILGTALLAGATMLWRRRST